MITGKRVALGCFAELVEAMLPLLAAVEALAYEMIWPLNDSAWSARSGGRRIRRAGLPAAL
jgi:hypothetical protein